MEFRSNRRIIQKSTKTADRQQAEAVMAKAIEDYAYAAPSLLEARKYRLKHMRYSDLGFTQKQVLRLSAEQEFRCAICSERQPPDKKGRPRTLHVDHCHKTNRFRGLLCAGCNVGLGYFRDNPWFLRAAANYLERTTMPDLASAITGNSTGTEHSCGEKM